MTAPIHEPVTETQIRRITQLGNTAIEQVLSELSKVEAECVCTRGDEFVSLIKKVVIRLSTSGKSVRNQVQSTHGYFSGYESPADVADQIDILRGHWPSLRPDKTISYMREVYPTIELPEWVEGPFALIRSGFFSNIYSEELEEVLRSITKFLGSGFLNRRMHHMSHFRQTTEASTMMRQTVDQQPNSDIIIVPGQFGIRYRGFSVGKVRAEMTPGEFGCGAKNAGTMFLTNPNRFESHRNLWVDCSGDEFDDPDTCDLFACAPFFRLYSNEINFGVRRVGTAEPSYGSASLFVPQA